MIMINFCCTIDCKFASNGDRAKASHHLSELLKLFVLMHSAHTSRRPKYLTDVLQPAAKYYVRPGLRSSSTNNYVLPRYQSRLGQRGDFQNIPDTSTSRNVQRLTYLTVHFK